MISTPWRRRCSADIDWCSGTQGISVDLLFGQHVVVMGCTQQDEYGEDYFDNVMLYDLVNLTWRSCELSGLPEVRNHATCVVEGSSLYLQGGIGFNRKDLSDRFCVITESQEDDVQDTYSTNRRLYNLNCEELEKPEGGQRYLHTLTLASDDDMLYLFGGKTKTRCLNDISEYSIYSETWTTIDPLGTLPEPRCHHSMTCVNVYDLILVGGMSFRGLPLVDVFKFDTLTQTWTELVIQADRPARVIGHTATLLESDFLVILGGHQGRSQIRYLDLRTKTWRSLPHQGGRITTSGHGTVALDDELLIFGGVDGDCNYTTLTLQIQPLLDKRIARPPVAAPAVAAPAVAAPAVAAVAATAVAATAVAAPVAAPVAAAVTQPPLPSHVSGTSPVAAVTVAGSVLSVDSSSLLGSTKYSDAGIVLDDGTRIPVHMLVLGSRCEYFDRLTTFQGTEVSEHEIHMSGVTRPTMMQVLAYIYGNILPTAQDFEGSALIYKLADRLGIDDLRDRVCEQILEPISMDNLIPLLTLGSQTNSTRIVNRCSEYLKTNASEAIRQDILLKLDATLMLSLLQSVLQSYAM